jgi:hypothetical protein
VEQNVRARLQKGKPYYMDSGTRITYCGITQGRLPSSWEENRKCAVTVSVQMDTNCLRTLLFFDVVIERRGSTFSYQVDHDSRDQMIVRSVNSMTFVLKLHGVHYGELDVEVNPEEAEGCSF